MVAPILTLVIILMSVYVQDGQGILGLVQSLESSTKARDIGRMVRVVLESTSESDCPFILLTHESDDVNNEFQDLLVDYKTRSRGIFKIPLEDLSVNVTGTKISDFVTKVRQWRWASRCTTVIVASDRHEFLVLLAQKALSGRLLTWSTKLLVVTSLPYSSLQDIMTNHWPYSAMNTMFLNAESSSQTNKRWLAYTHLPYPPEDMANVVPLASWSLDSGLVPRVSAKEFGLFPAKYENFHGNVVNVTAVHWPPYWVENVELGKGTPESISGSDGLLLHSIGQALNFTFMVILCKNWYEVTALVNERVSLMAPVFHMLLHTRLDRYDYSYAYEFAFYAFCMAKPELKPSWQGLYYPLAGQVWLSTVVALLIMPIVIYMVMNSKPFLEIHGSQQQMLPEKPTSIGVITEEIVAVLLWQNLTGKISKNTPSLLLLIVWIIFAFIVGTVYRGNLTASLTLPTYPPRPETTAEMVDSVDRITLPPIGEDMRKAFSQSGSDLLVRYAARIHTGPTILQGLQQAAKIRRQSQVAVKRVLQHLMINHFIEADGSNPLYVGRESILPGLSAWPIQHDAPYKTQIDSVMMAVIEGGLYNKWADDTLLKTERESREKQRKLLMSGKSQGIDDVANTVGTNALTIIHMQGPFMLAVIGYSAAAIAFLIEIIVFRCSR